MVVIHQKLRWQPFQLNHATYCCPSCPLPSLIYGADKALLRRLNITPSFLDTFSLRLAQWRSYISLGFLDTFSLRPALWKSYIPPIFLDTFLLRPAPWRSYLTSHCHIFTNSFCVLSTFLLLPTIGLYLQE